MIALAALALVACSSAPAEQQVQTKIVEVEKPVVVEKEVMVPGETVVVEKEAIKEVPVQKVVTVEKEVIKEVVREVRIESKATPEPIKMEPSKFGYLMHARESTIKRGGIVRMGGPVEMAHWDLH